ncbi:MAG: ABC transporter ATP-binding protein [Thermoleophilia bacterium]|nr:ABC transporter ATP-binding protein [Thermoleophilia bacterium]
MNLLKLEKIKSGYWKIPVLHEIDFSVEEGEMVLVIGPNGAGKSTLMKTIARLLWITSGEISFRGRDALKLQAHDMAALGLGYVPQDHNVFPDLTVEDNLRISFLDKAEFHETLRSVYDRFPVLGERRRQRAGTLSGGERQMLAIGCALMQKPVLLVLDEPTSGLAPQIRGELNDIIIDINSGGTSIVWVVEENPEEALRRAERVYFLDSGTVKKTGDPGEFLGEHSLEELFLGAGT